MGLADAVRVFLGLLTVSKTVTCPECQAVYLCVVRYYNKDLKEQGREDNVDREG